MKYPNFLKRNDLIGITAISSGMGNDLVETKISFNHLKENYKLIITPNVYGDYIVSSDINTRINEFNNLVNQDINMLYLYRGGDFTYELLDYLDYEKIVNKRLLVGGYSDITSLLYILTTKYDFATIYGFNAKSYDSSILEPYQINNLEILKGNLIIQECFMDRNTISINGDFTDYGIIIGGCLDVLRYIPGTSYDNTISFIDKYKNNKIIWYFDIYSISSIDTYLTLLQMKNMGWFKYTDTVIFGSIKYPKVENNLEYLDGIKKVFSNKNIIYDANIGHVKPVFTIINGSLASILYKDNKMILKMEFFDENNS